VASTSAEVGPTVQRHEKDRSKQFTDQVPSVKASSVTDRVGDERTTDPTRIAWLPRSWVEMVEYLADRSAAAGMLRAATVGGSNLPKSVGLR